MHIFKMTPRNDAGGLQSSENHVDTIAHEQCTTGFIGIIGSFSSNFYPARPYLFDFGKA